MNSRYLSLLFIVLTFSGCFGVKQAGGNSAPSNKLYEIFYLADGATQYFTKPQNLSYKNSEDHSFDLLFRKKDEKSDSIVVNMTAYTLNPLTKDAKPFIEGNDKRLSGNDFSIIYTEKSKERFKNRISFKLPYQEFLTVIATNSFAFSLETKDNATIKLTTSKKTEKNIEKLKRVFLY